MRMRGSSRQQSGDEMEDVRRDEAAQAAYSTLRKNRKALSDAVTIGCIAEDLYSSDLIDDDTMEAAMSKSSSDREKGNKIMRQVQKTVKVKPELFDVFCQVLSKEAVTERLARELKGTSVFRETLSHRAC